MTGPSVLIGNVDELTAHFAEWFLFLKAKGHELGAQQSKLEARKTKVSTPMPAGERDFLDNGFEEQLDAISKTTPAVQPSTVSAPDCLAVQDDDSGSQMVEPSDPGEAISLNVLLTNDEDDLA